MKVLTLFINERCNRQCSYCDIPQIKNKSNVNIELIKKYIPYINQSDFDRVVLTGGEIGLLDNKTIELLLSIEKDIGINTNGLFLKRYWDEYQDKICAVTYHPVSEINEEIKIKYSNPKIHYLVPVHKNNINFLESFLEQNKEIEFTVSPYDSKHNDENTLSKDDCQKILQIIRGKNVNNQTIKTFELILKLDLDVVRASCNCNLFMSIDFVRAVINNCVCSHTRSSTVPLTLENFKNISNIKFQQAEMCDTCLSCVGWFNELIKHKMEK